MTETSITTQLHLRPISKQGLEDLAATAKANPNVVKSLHVKTVCEGQFRNLNYVRNLPAHIIDEPPSLLGQDTAPNPSEAVLAALGSCLSVGIHANAMKQFLRNVCVRGLWRGARLPVLGTCKTVTTPICACNCCR
jgi:hypothetical protein